jgi:hypothetical protein
MIERRPAGLLAAGKVVALADNGPCSTVTLQADALIDQKPIALELLVLSNALPVM